MDSLTGALTIGLGALFMVLALAPGTAIGPALSRDPTLRRPMSRVGRACFFLAGLAVAVEGYRRGVLHRPPLEIPVGRWLSR